MDFASDYDMTVDGQGVPGAATMPVVNPATGEVIALAPACSGDQLDQAVTAARAAFPAWSTRSIVERRAMLLAVAARIHEHSDALARLLTREQGKPLDQAVQEIAGAAHYLKSFSSLELPVTVTDPADGSGKIVETRHAPVGVVGGIAPWNFPIILGMFKIAPALLAGNTLVLKPSPFTPLTTLRLGELTRDILPPGVLNIISGGDELGPWMTAHSGFDKISFTGSTQTGRKVMANAANDLKRLTLELGGNDAAIVMPDVDIAAVVEPLFWSAFRNSGQICIATKRMYVHEDIYEPFKAALVAYAKTVKVGDGTEQGVQIGPVNNAPQFERVMSLIADCKANGHDFALGGERRGGPGYFIPVTIIDNPPEHSRIVAEEQFGPVLPLLKYAKIDDAIARANNTDYGLGGSIWSGDEDRAVGLAQRLNTGNVWINDLQYLTPLAAFGGQKQSGIGVEGGVEGLLEYTVPQNVIRRKGPGG